MTLGPVPAHLRRAIARLALALSLGLGTAVWAQDASVDFGGLRADTTLPVEVTADTLKVDNATGAAVFSGNVRVSQGEMRLGAGEVTVIYAADRQAIDRLEATGGVTLANAADAAEAERAVYTVSSGIVVMTGKVLLTQGATTLAAETLTINLQTGTGVLEGGVTTTFTPGSAP